MSEPRRTPRVLSIAGSDSGGGAGVQADLKAFARCGVHGMTAITAITAQNTVGVRAIHAIPPEIVLAQVRAVVEDIGVDAVKVGMLGSAPVTCAVATALRELPAGMPIVVDPVMVAESGARLLERDAQQALVEEVLPLATVATPNVPEARVLTGVAKCDADEEREAEALARRVLALGPRCVVLTGGHRARMVGDRTVDLYLEATPESDPVEDLPDSAPVDAPVDAPVVPAGAPVEIPGERHPDGAAHGSGCTHSSVLAAHLALGYTPLEAARAARRLAGEAVASGLRDIGAGAGPVDILGLGRLRGDIIGGR